MTDPLSRLKAALADRYAIERELGVGGMATVYLAEDLKLHRKVAVKVLRPELSAALGTDRFLQEIEIAAQLHHPHILPLYDSGDADGFLYYIMPYEEGQSLRDKLAKEGELPIPEAVRILRDVADALSHAHKHNVVHRDIKPDNVMLSDRHALVTDFGVAKAVSEATGRQKLTTEGIALGTPAYMAPEQAAADPHIDHRADIYAVGAVAYELLTGRTPFVGNTQQELLAAHVTQTPDPVVKYRESVPPALAELVMKCLEKKPADRWQSAEELLPQLEALATPSGGLTPTGTMPVTAIAGRRWFVPGVVAAAVVLVVIGVVLSRMLAPSPITITTSNIRAVTSEPGLEWQPVLSPDGSQVAFTADRAGRQSVVIRSAQHIAGELTPTVGLNESREVFPAWSADGEFVRFCTGPDVTAWTQPIGARSLSQCKWMETGRLGGSIRSMELPGNAALTSRSPDGSRVAFVAMPDSIFVYTLSDGTATPLAIPETLNSLHSLAWSPDGRWIAYVNGNLRWLTSFNVGTSAIWIVDVHSGELVRVTGDQFMDVSPAWLDQNHLLFVSNRNGPREVYAVEVGSTGPRGEPWRFPGVTDPHSISYSITGRNLAFSKATVSQNIWSYPIGLGPVSISDGHPVTNDNAVIEAHDISPDGKWIAYSSNLRGNMDIYKRLLEGGSPTPITNSLLDEFEPQWSPDGTEISFFRALGASQSQAAVMVVPEDGGTPIQLAIGRMAFHPGWSPSGLAIAFCSDRTGRPEAWIVAREALGGSWGEPTQLTDFGCIPRDWAPDGSGVLCAASAEAASAEMVLVSLEGEALWRYDISTTGLRAYYGRPRFSSDGSMINVAGSHEDGSQGIWAIPTHGGEANLLAAVDDAEIGGLMYFSVGPDHLYVTVGEYEVDIWVMDVEVER